MPKSVGAIIQNEEGKILLVERKNIPLGWAAPAGHVDEGESNEEALLREVKEETGLTVLDYELIHEEYVEWNVCKRHKGHNWSVYKVNSYEGEVDLEEKELNDYKWFELQSINVDDFEPVWLYFFKKLNFL